MKNLTSSGKIISYGIPLPEKRDKKNNPVPEFSAENETLLAGTSSSNAKILLYLSCFQQRSEATPPPPMLRKLVSEKSANLQEN